ncbi:MAG TPA: flagellar biosynthesis protein FlhF [bacterium]|nr:flagellar biosynthesis protein FlhF [bacterium]
MRIRRYEAPTIQEALMKVKKDLGPEAVILYTKTFRKGGVMGLFGRPMAEITAGVDLNLLDDVAKRKASLSPVVAERAEASIPKAMVKSPAIPQSAPTGTLDPNRIKVKALQRELNEMKTSSVASALRDMNQLDPSALLSPGFARLRKKLSKQEVEEFLIQKMIKGMMTENVDPDRSDEVYRWIHQFVGNALKIAGPGPASQYQKVLAFVGPTGVGKTTTLAKLAARFNLMERKKVAMITADTYRIAATEQLKTYGRIMGIPVEVAESAEDVPTILAKYRSMDLVLIDTAGRSPSSDDQLEELKYFISKSQADEIHLVLSATTKYLDMIRIIERFGSAVPLNRMIFTKLDETRFYGAFLNLMNNFQIPLSFYSTGQNVPDDLEVPEVHSLAERISKMLLS